MQSTSHRSRDPLNAVADLRLEESMNRSLWEVHRLGLKLKLAKRLFILSDILPEHIPESFGLLGT